jgi:hypothetical protein
MLATVLSIAVLMALGRAAMRTGGEAIIARQVEG